LQLKPPLSIFSSLAGALVRAADTLEERGMTKEVTKKVWKKPEVKRLGELKDISAGAPSNTQGNFT
jgi:hypothetical protein